ncbi:lysozyme [Phenylobacterium sp.]|jgi:lysozyme|uniref:lysozyme n=1 Tax=Phenylobacterium sp. TaxID=1871053 RepID=UPI002E30128C|nr:lysozyme [Phenylobacterium sp.]HEX3364774.1 lysozyme [Phenylobacterium sp.]
MEPRHRASRTALELIKRFEGYRQTAAQLPDGRWTIGHGHTLTARQGAEVSGDDAEALLLYDLIGVGHALNEAVFTPLNQNQFDALASFVFNIGLDSFHQSGVLKRLNEGAVIQAACEMELWRKANVGGERIVIDALVRRRSVEKTLFLTPPGEAWVPAPSPILKPLLDTDARDLVPLQAPVEVTAELEGDQLVVRREGEPTPRPVAPDDEDGEGPAKTAAEAVTARLSTIFQEPGEAPVTEEDRVHPEHIPDAPHPQADFGAPPEEPRAEAPTAPPPPFEDPVPFFLRAPEPEPEPEPHAPLEPWRSRIETEDDEPRGGSLFDDPDLDVIEEASFADVPLYDEDPFAQDRVVIDDAAPPDFEAPVVQPLPVRPQGGVLTLLALAALGLVFFGGGIFWATYARAAGGLMGPRLVGGLAGIAGVGFFVVAVYLLLERLGRAAERQARDRH